MMASTSRGLSDEGDTAASASGVSGEVVGGGSVTISKSLMTTLMVKVSVGERSGELGAGRDPARILYVVTLGDVSPVGRVAGGAGGVLLDALPFSRGRTRSLLLL